MEMERARAIASRYGEARNSARLDLLDDIYAADVVIHDCSTPEDILGLEALKAFYRESHAGFPDFHIEWDDVMAAGEKVVLRWTIEATHTGELRGMPATGRRVRFQGVAVERLEGDRIVEEWVYFNVLGLLQQLGVAPG